MAKHLIFYVILPTIGRDSCGAAIESVYEQTYPYARFLVIDDIPPHQDYGAWARNAGLDKLSDSPEGWVTYIDDDDVWLPHHLETMAKIIEENPNVNLIRTAGVQFFMKHKHPRSSRLVRRLGPPNFDDVLTVGMCHKSSLPAVWQPCDNHDKLLWNELIVNHNATPFVSKEITFEFKR